MVGKIPLNQVILIYESVLPKKVKYYLIYCYYLKALTTWSIGVLNVTIVLDFKADSDTIVPNELSNGLNCTFCLNLFSFFTTNTLNFSFL